MLILPIQVADLNRWKPVSRKADSDYSDLNLLARRLDRIADQLLQKGRHRLAEHPAHRAAALRQSDAA